VFIANHGAQPVLYRNDGVNENDWLKIKLQGTVSNRDGLGALVTVDPDTMTTGDEMVRELNGGSNFLGHNELVVHFGLGASTSNIDLITVAWPSGTVQQLTNVPANQMLNLIESAGPVPLEGDYNDDFVVDAADYVIWRAQLGEMGAGIAADGNNDQTVNQMDYDLWRGNFGASAGGFVAAAQVEVVPEPSTALLFVVGSVVARNLVKSQRVRRAR
jgi:hypothetical protein